MVEKVKEKILHILRMDGEPKDIALAFAIGVFIAFFPIFGIHTILAIGGAWILGLSPAIALAGTFVNNPWTIPLVYGGGLYIGLILTGESLTSLNIDFGEYSWSSLLDWQAMVDLFKVIGVPFVIGCIVLGLVAGAFSYILMLKAVVAYRSRSAEPG